MRRRSWVLVLFLLAGCSDGGDGDDGCVPGTTVGCDSGLFCEVVQGGEPACFLPIELRGRVFDSATGAGIGGATVVALDANGAARSPVAVTADDGAYALRVPVARTDETGAFPAEQVVLRVAAQGYQWFAKPPRTALPVDLKAATADEALGAAVVRGPETDVALVALPGDTSGLVRISGAVQPPVFDLPDQDVGGVLVVAEQGAAAVATAVSGDDGTFTLHNVPKGATTVRGFRAGLVVTPETLTVSGDVADVVLETAAEGTAAVSGSVNIVNAPGGSQTSVILVVGTTFDATIASGEAPAGLRAFPVDSAFRIEGVPPGDYVVLAAFENDDLVRDPDESIGGTEIVRLNVPEGGGDVSLPQSFKVTEALAVVSPGADGTEDVAASEPTFTWADDSSEDGYELRVYDVLGTQVLEETALPRVTGGATVSYSWTGAALEPGMIYQFRVLSYRDDKDGRVYISATEDLKGVFRYAPPPAP